MLTIYLIRHGETLLNKQGRLRGWCDVSLTAKGRKQAYDAGKAMDGIDIDVMYVSDLKRAKETGAAIKAEMEGKIRKVVVTPLLRPINFGEWNGEKLSDVGPKMDELQKKWEKDGDVKSPGVDDGSGVSGESFNDFQARMEELADEIKRVHADGSIAVVAHLRNCIWFIVWAMNNGIWIEGDAVEMLGRVTQQVGSVSVLTYDGDGGWKVQALSTKDPAEVGKGLAGIGS